MGLEAYYVDDRKTDAVKYERNHLTLIARDDQGFRNLVKLTCAGFLEGYKRGKANVDMELLSQHSEGVIALTGCLASRFCQRLAEDNRHEARAHADELLQVFGTDNVYFEVQKNGIALQDKVNEGIVDIAREVGRPVVGTADVHYLGREDYHNHSALLCVQTKSTLAEPKMSFDTNEFYLKDTGEMTAAFEAWPEAVPTTLEIAERCDVDIELGNMLIPSYPTPGRAARGRLPARAGPGRAARALRRPDPRRGDRAAGHGARGDRPDGLRRLLPDRLGLRQVRQGQRHRGGPGPWLGGGLDRVLRAGHHRGRPAQVRPAVRALPEPRAGVDAGHRHRLLGQGPRARHALRREQVRPRVGGPDRHLRQDAAAQRHPRRRARARQGLRGRRPAGQAHPRADHGPLAVAGQVPGRGARAQEGLRHRRRGARGHRHRPRARGHRPQRRACTPPRSSSPTGR